MIPNFISSHILSMWPLCEKETRSGIAEQENFTQHPPSELPPDQITFWKGHTQLYSRQCANMAEFIHTYIHPYGLHTDGSPMSDREQQKEIEFATLVDSIMRGRRYNSSTMPERRVTPFRLNGFKSILAALLYILSGMGAMAFPVYRKVSSCEFTDNSQDIAFCQQLRFESEKPKGILCSYAGNCLMRQYPDSSFTVKSSHSVCKSISDRHPMINEFDRINKSFRDELSATIDYPLQEKIIQDYQSMSLEYKNQNDSNVALILSGGTRATAQLTKENHLAYARLRGIKYRFVYPFEFQEELGAKQLYWMKVFALKNALECEEVSAGQWVVWLDDDIVINDFTSTSGMLDKYIEQFGEADMLVAGDNSWAILNTGIILVKKTEKIRSFLHMWALYSNDRVKGYQPQKDTLHEQDALKHLIKRDSYFREINEDMNLVRIVPNRVRTKGLNLNTYKREEFVKQQRWYDHSTKIQGCDEEQQQGYEDGDSFIHHGTKLFRTQLIVESLQQALDSYKHHKEISQ